MAGIGKQSQGQLDLLLGRIAIERGIIARDDLKNTLAEQSRDLAGGGKARPLGIMLVAKGYITDAQLTALLDEQKAKALDAEAARRQDMLLGRLLIQRGQATPEQVNECLRVQAEAVDDGQNAPRLGELLVQRGYAAAEAISESLAVQQKTIEDGRGLPASAVPATAGLAEAPEARRRPPPTSPEGRGQPARRSLGEGGPARRSPSGGEGGKPAPTRAPAAPPFGKYAIVRELGRGGMGVVYEAADTELKRKVALKMMLASPNADAKEVRLDEERFLREARLSANLAKHPHIVGVYEAGVLEGQRYIAMEYIQGRPMSEWRRMGSVTMRQQVTFLRDIALAVHHAHEHGIIHRDLKPHNVLVDDKNQQPHVMDFGLAKTAGQSVTLSLTASGMVVGTPAYMSPEQAQGFRSIDRRTDVYSLGVMLYEIVTGRVPFTGNTAIEILMKVVKDPVPLPSKVLEGRPAVAARTAGVGGPSGARPPGGRGLEPAPTLDKAIENICLKALAKSADERYPTAKAIADDLSRWLRGEEVKVVAPRPARGTRAPWIYAAAAAGLLGLGALMFWTSKPSVDRELAQAEKFVKEKKYIEALVTYGQALAKEPGNAEALDGKKNVEDRLKRAAEAARQSTEQARRDLEAKIRAETTATLKGEREKLAAERKAAEEKFKAAQEGERKARAQLGGGLFQEHRYQVFLDQVTWHEAKKRCEDLGGYLVCVESAEEERFLEEFFKKRTAAPVWLGATDEAREGNWKWVNGQPFNYTNWAPGEPNNAAGQEHYLVMKFGAQAGTPGKWNDDSETSATGVCGFICEWGENVTKAETSATLDAERQKFTAERTALEERARTSEPAVAEAKPDPPKIADAPKPPEPTPPEPAVKSPPPAPARPPVPDAARQREAEAAVRKAFPIGQARTPKDKTDLARTLLSTAAASGAKDAELYVLLRHARDLAAQGMDVKTALEAIDARAAAFDVDAMGEKEDLFAKATVKGADAAAWAGAVLDVAEEASAADDYEAAMKLAGRAEALARTANDRGLQETAKEREKDFADLKRVADGLKGHFKTLETKPDDPAANASVGRFVSFVKGDWKRGLPMLAKGLEAALKTLAEQELANPTEAAAQAALGEAWAAQAEKETPTYKPRVRGRAAEWLVRAIPGLTGLAKVSAERKLASLGPASATKSRQVLDLGAGVRMELVYIWPGVFTMGGTQAPGPDWQADERPEHKVAITKSYYLGKYEVTRGQFAAFVKTTGYKTEAERDGKASGRTAGGQGQEVAGNNWLTPATFAQTDDHPVTCMSWNDAKAFCDWATKKTGRTVRLPTEAEWEYACRAGTKTTWSFGNQESAMADYGWYDKNAGGQTHPVGQKKPNAWGLFDMHGNVWEWCQDWAGPYAGDAVDPTGPASGDRRVLRGGVWYHPVSCARSAFRDRNPQSYWDTHDGFRACVP